MDVFVTGIALYPATVAASRLRLEEMVYRTTKQALAHAGVSRKQLDNVTLGASDEVDGRPISNMLMAGPAGGYLLDEIRVTDSGASDLGLAFARLTSGDFNLGLCTSWCKPSKIDREQVMHMRAEPFFTRPIGINAGIAEGLFAQAASRRFGIDDSEIESRLLNAYQRAARNERGASHAVPTAEEIRTAPYECYPMRSVHRAPFTDGAAALVLASERFVRTHRDCRPLARISGIGWASDSYRLDGDRLSAMRSATNAWNSALARANRKGHEIDVVEIDSQTAFHEAAYVRAFGIEEEARVSPSGGPFAQNPYFCSGLVNACEAVLQVAGQAGGTQREGVKVAAAHGCHGLAQQGNVVMVFEGLEH